MKSIKSLLFLVPFLCLFFTLTSFAADTDLYIGGGSGIEPNLLIIFDNSGSMNDSPVQTYCAYDPSYSYPQPSGQPSINPIIVYKKGSKSWFPLSVFKNKVADVPCANAQTVLTTYGQGIYGPAPTDSTCNNKNTKATLATGNWLRFNYADPANLATCTPKINIARNVITNFLSALQGVRVGVMIFNPTFTRPSDGQDEAEGGHILDEIKALDNNDPSDTTYSPNNRQQLINDVTAIQAPSNQWTPLAETLYEAGLYFQGAQSYFNSPPFTSSVTTYTSPIRYYCQKNYIVIMTDGISTKDRNPILNTIGDQDGDQREPPGAPNDPNFDGEGSDFLDDVAKYLYNTDLRPDLQGQQNVVTYTIGFALDSSDPGNAPKAKDLLQRTATQGHGNFYTTDGSAGLADAFSSVLNEVLAVTSSFVAPIVPVNRMERTSSGDKIYLAFFRPNQTGMWSGNIKKYGVQQTNDTSKGLVAGDIVDVSGSKALDSNGAFYPSSKSYWTTSSSDGGDVQTGGVGEVLQNRTTPRNIYTLLPSSDQQLDKQVPDSNTSFDLTNSWNAFTTTNSRVTPSLLGVSTTQDKDSLVNFVRGIDAYDDNMNGSYTDNRDWMLGSFLHSRPCIIQYADRTVIYAGSNDGMLHAFNDSDGQELWGFIPPSLLGRLKELHTDTPGIFVDGSPKAYVSYNSDGITVNKAILIFGLRRGGNYYYALDVTNPLVPKYLYRIYQNKGLYFEDLAQTWSTPVIGKVKNGTADQWVAIFGAGYDENEDILSPPADIYGRGVYMVDVLTGAAIWWHSYPGGDHNMTYCIPSDIAALDIDGNGYIDRLYAGDMNGRMWRFDIGNANNTGSWTAKIIFQSNAGSSDKRKIFYPPDVTLEKDNSGNNYEMLFFGTGNREDPNGTKDMDRLYAVKDKNPSSPLGEGDLVNVTNFYSLSAAQQASTLGSIKTGYGWYIVLDRKTGEKCLASPLVYYKTAYYTTFSPTQGSQTDPCFVGEGTATLYAVNYTTGEAVLNLDLTNDVGGTVVMGKTDRSTVIGTAIPSGVVVTVIGGKIGAYVGVGGGVYRPTLTSKKSLFPMTWKLVF